MTTIPGAGPGPLRRTAHRAAHRAGRFLLRGFASLAAMSGVLPAEHFRAAARQWTRTDTPAPPAARGPAAPPEPWVTPRGGTWGEAEGVAFPWGLPPVGGAVLPLDEPPPAHPERLARERPPTPGERALWAQLEGPAPPF
ncbi:hypothetical protein ABT354_30235 [Streptomyces sp. NPDC000594]|uniref:hypothetical protein n=1 Tax=Streptomyces sp. NPDC000594 TaxID=3154261 RepID=UPI0033220F4D